MGPWLQLQHASGRGVPSDKLPCLPSIAATLVCEDIAQMAVRLSQSAGVGKALSRVHHLH